MNEPRLVSREEWLEARLALLEEEKAQMRRADELAARRRELPWIPVEKEYTFDTVDGPKSLAELFDGRSQLAMYHFMFGPDWTQGCHRCSYWADGFDGIDIHLAHRDLTFLVCSSAPLEKLQQYRERMGWSFNWVSASPSDFNHDWAVSWTQAELEAGQGVYNHGTGWAFFTEMQGLSVFARTPDGGVAHTYSTFARGIDVFSSAYQILDLTPKGRDEDDLGPDRMRWIQRHDQYA